jgi:hypothetical protein
MPSFIHDFDLMASLTSDIEDFTKLPPEMVIKAMRDRLDAIAANPSEILEAFGHVATNDTL